MKRLWSTQELTQHWALSPADLALTIGHTDRGKLGLACQLAFWREHARFPELEANLAPAVVEHLAAQIDVPADAIGG